MRHLISPPSDQAVVDDYFLLIHKKTFASAGWLYGMLATYGISLKQLKGFSWNADNTINVPDKKRKVYPVHPQWVFLFQLKEKQPSKLESCLDDIQSKLETAIKTKVVSLNLTDLLLSYRIRKTFYRQHKEDQRKESLSSAVLCAR